MIVLVFVLALGPDTLSPVSECTITVTLKADPATPT